MSLQPPKIAFPAANSPQRAGAASGASNPTAGKARNKVKLAPGFGLHDWVKLTREKSDLAGAGGQLHRITPKELAKHSSKTDAWMSLRGKVYNITKYMHYHPGGIDELMKAAGKDGTDLFNEIHQWVNAESMLEKCLVGFLVPVYSSDSEEEGEEPQDEEKEEKSEHGKSSNAENSSSDSLASPRHQDSGSGSMSSASDQSVASASSLEFAVPQKPRSAAQPIAKKASQGALNDPAASPKSPASAVEQQQQQQQQLDLPPVRYDWYETASHIVVILYVRGVQREDIVSDRITPTSIALEVMIAPDALQPIQAASSSSPSSSSSDTHKKCKLFFRVELKIPILHEQSVTTFNAVKLGVSLRKENQGQMARDIGKVMQMWLPAYKPESAPTSASSSSTSLAALSATTVSMSASSPPTGVENAGRSAFTPQSSRFVLGKVTYMAAETYNTFWVRVFVPLPLPHVSELSDGAGSHDGFAARAAPQSVKAQSNLFGAQAQIQPISVIGLGQHVELAVYIEGTHVSRPYTPVRVSVLPDGRAAELEFLIKRYEDGTLTPVLNELKVGGTLDVSGALGVPFDLQQYTHIGMVAGGTGLTPMLRIIRACDSENVTRTATGRSLITVSLVFCNTSAQDILARNELDEYVALQPWFHLHHIIKYPPNEPLEMQSEITVDYGTVNSKTLRQRLASVFAFPHSPSGSPSPSSGHGIHGIHAHSGSRDSSRSQLDGPHGASTNEIVLVCGRPSFTRDVGRMLKEELHVPAHKVHAFTG